jgi:hypothetical protein
MHDFDGSSSGDTTTDERDRSRRMARRYFVKATIYAAPAIASVVAVQHASAQSSFCAQNCTNPALCPLNPACAANNCTCQ